MAFGEKSSASWPCVIVAGRDGHPTNPDSVQGSSMEIQSFLLAERIHKKGNRFDVENAGLANLDCTPETEFPLRFTVPPLILLRRESIEGNAPFSLRFTLVNEDGEAAGRPNHLE